jgi:hypothetical protein
VTGELVIVGARLAAVTVSVIVAGAEFVKPSWARKEKLSLPAYPSVGV